MPRRALFLNLISLFCVSCAKPAAQGPVIATVDIPPPVASSEPSASSAPPAANTVNAPPKTASPFAEGQVWVGEYLCPQGPTKLVLKIQSMEDDKITALFDFEHAPTNVHGAYLVEGSYVSEVANLAPLRWINEPRNYVMVGLEGAVDGCEFAGRIDNELCGQFSLELRGCRK